MKLAKIVYASAATAMALTAATPSTAATMSTFNVELDDGFGAFSRSKITTGAFTDFINFDTSMSGVADVGLSYLFSAKGITNLTASFNGVAFALVQGQGSGNFYQGSISAPVGSGPQQLVLSGISAGSQAAYSGTVIFSAVPEPTSWALMIVGFGAAGVSLRRRRSNTKVSVAFA